MAVFPATVGTSPRMSRGPPTGVPMTATTSTRTAPQPVEVLRILLRLDALSTAAIGLTAAIGARALDEPLGIPAGVLLGLGLALLGWAALAAYGSLGAVRVGVGRVIGLGNAAWVAGSLLAAVLVHELTTLGTSVVVAQAVAVAALAALQLVTVRRCS